MGAAQSSDAARLDARSRARPRPRKGVSIGAPPPVALSLGREAVRDLSIALAREWIETDGHGGYAALTVAGCPTRRQHGLLVAPYPGQLERHVFLSRFEETLELGDVPFPLSIARYAGLWSPHGHRTLEGFEALPWPTTTHMVGEATLVREVLMPGTPGTVLVRWRLEGAAAAARLVLKPLLPYRDANALTVENGALQPRSSPIAAGVRCRPYPELPEITLTVGGASARYDADPVWYRRLEYATDAARGYEGLEDQFSPGALTVTLAPGKAVVVAATIGETVADPVGAFDRAARARRAAHAAAGPGLRGVLAYGADRFLAKAPDGRTTVVAGWPWFGVWGRDTFLAVPGLCFARGRVEEGGDVLEGSLRFLKDGRFPNRFGGTVAASDFHTADAPLWFARAVRLYELAGGSPRRLRDVFVPALRAIVRAFEKGNDVGREDPEGMLLVGTPKTNLTWMDARVDGVPVTPRWGAPVEIAALWVFLRRYLADLVLRREGAAAARPFVASAGRSAATFLSRLWLPRSRHLADGWHDGQVDDAVRPNMVLAAALEWSPLSKTERRDVVATAEAELLTPRGLRTLDPGEKAYQHRYEGGVVARDRAYHQGTVWPWLVGAYVEAVLLAHGRSRATVARLRALLDGFAPATEEFGLGHVAEVYDGDPPHRPGGTFAQAWSDAELLRAYALLDDVAPRRAGAS